MKTGINEHHNYFNWVSSTRSRWVAFIWRSRVYSFANFLWQWEHKIGLSWRWIERRWRLRSPLWQNPLEQWGHANGFSLLWKRWCVTRSLCLIYPLPHWGQRWGSVPRWMWRWRAKSQRWMKDLLQISQRNRWSSFEG